MKGAPTTPTRSTRTLLVLVAILVGIIVGLGTGILMAVSGSVLATAAISGGVAFGSTVPLVLLIESTLGLL
ncbi:hypothetical protein [Actinoplanes palleronii]|uniref:Uncharacterized protein n=1 Tax=Actinoplanes palleronii TaxID=113570 RepID=A0ABQ4B5L0_9ACTN|nr:hypothetical protein [Actinoplanes palleronii]GIE65545.1 hypothetical protein Apa02nite_016530 [Actinoplanes palleronii]